MTKRLAIISSGINSPLNSALQFAIECRELGYEIKILAPASAGDVIAHYKFMHKVIPDPKVDAFKPLLSEKFANSLTNTERKSAAVSALGVDDLNSALADADAIFVDCELHAHILVALSLKKPVVQFTNMFLSPPGLQAPPLNRRGIPGHGFRGSKLGVAILWARFLVWKKLKIVRNRRSSSGTDVPTALEELAQRRNVPLSTLRRWICWQMPWTYKIPTVLLLPKALDLPTRQYANMEYLGPMILENRQEKDYDRETVARFCAAPSQSPRIFVGFGSMMKAKRGLVKNILEVARRHPEWNFLFAAGQDWEELAAEKTHANVSIAAWVPQQEILKHADLAIMHGGTGGLVEAVDAGTPLLVYPHVNDQRGSAARVVHHGIGRAGTPIDSVEKIESDISAILTDSSIRANCETLKTALRRERNNCGLEPFLDRLFAAAPP